MSVKTDIAKMTRAKWFSGLLAPTRIQATAVRFATLAMIAVAAAAVPGFASVQNLSAVMFSASAIGIAACGLALVTISGKLFMLSIGATTAVSTIVFASLLGYGVPAALAGTVLIGLICGLIQGCLVGFLRANPIISTIAVASIITGIGSWFSAGRTITGDGTSLWLGVGHVLPGIPNQVLVFVAVLLAAEFLLSRTRVGRELQLNGINPVAAEFAGLRTGTAVTAAYCFAGAAASLSGALIASQAAQGNLSLGADLDFSATAAVLVGGVSISGGQGRIYDAATGALFLAIVGNILILKGYAFDTQLMVKGAVVLLSVLAGAALTRNRKK
ncbi:ABC transporter permease (plasmid) [Rhizobium lusitanum]|nr:ABC transporter permease [Rhizobium lusitanum]